MSQHEDIYTRQISIEQAKQEVLELFKRMSQGGNNVFTLATSLKS